MGSEQTNQDYDLNVLVQIGNLTFTHADLLNFEYKNAINDSPQGEFKLIDRNGDFIKLGQGADFGRIAFTNTSDSGIQKSSFFPFIIDDLQEVDVVAANVVYKIKWSAGSIDSIDSRTKAFSGTSVSAMKNAMEDFSEIDVIEYPSDTDQPSDAMMWRIIRDNLFGALNTIVSKSYKRNDFIFWAWDEVNNKFKISSYNNEKEFEDRYLFIQSNDAVASTGSGKTHLDNPKFTVWQYDKDMVFNDLGRNRGKLFPNVSFSGVRGTDLLSAPLQQSTFGDLLREIGDDKQEEVLLQTGLKNPNSTFGELIIKRHWPNNTHKLYSFADVYREYKDATYCKIIILQIYNNVGPPLGSKVTVFKTGFDYKVRGMTLNEEYSDFFLVKEKLINYNAVSDLSTSGPKNVSTNFVTTLKLVSDNFAGNGLEHVAAIFKQIQEVIQ